MRNASSITRSLVNRLAGGVPIWCGSCRTSNLHEAGATVPPVAGAAGCMEGLGCAAGLGGAWSAAARRRQAVAAGLARVGGKVRVGPGSGAAGPTVGRLWPSWWIVHADGPDLPLAGLVSDNLGCEHRGV